MLKVHVEQSDSMRVAPLRAEQLRSQRANGGRTRYAQPPTCSNPRCEGLCRLCSAEAASAALIPDETGDEVAKLARGIVRAHKREAKRNPAPAIVKREARMSYEREGKVYAAARDAKQAEYFIGLHDRTRKQTETVLRTASDARKQAKRASIARQAPQDAAAFRRTVDADERRDPRVKVDSEGVTIPSF